MLNSTATILIVGRNRSMLFERLKKRKILLLKVKIIDDKRLFIKVKYKDAAKVFEICKNMWYNKLVAVNGPRRILSFFLTKLPLTIAAALFIAAICVLDNFVLFVDFSGVPKAYLKKAARIIDGHRIGFLTPFSAIDYKGVGKELLSIDGVGYASAEKAGYSLKLTVKADDMDEAPVKSRKNIVADVDGIVKSVSVYRGRALKKVGDQVKAGDIIADGAVELADGSISYGDCMALIVVERSFTEDILSDEDTPSAVSRATATAKLGYDDVCSCRAEVIPFEKRYIIKVTVATNVVYGD
ncbi:MAG: sporulation protein YqfD [Clostridia bacterium]|nr:sporulation protein YqfD [Clostridia bacterium]